jgi:hypothetical protein
MRGLNASTRAGRFRQTVTLGRVATWSSFGAAVFSQAALLTGGYFLTDEASPNALGNAALAGSLAAAGIVIVMLARRVGDWAQSRAVAPGRAPLRLVPEAKPGGVGRHHRPAA